MFHDWDIRLANYVDSVSDRGFDWDGFDCLHFVNNAVAAQRGEGFADEWLGECKCNKTAYKHYRTMMKRFGHETAVEALDARLRRRKSLSPMRGDVVGRYDPDNSVVGISLGVAISDLIAFVGHNGLVFSKPEPDDIYWSIT